MCEAKPGTRCAADTRAAAQQAMEAYHGAYPDGPAVDPIASAAAHSWAERIPGMNDQDQERLVEVIAEDRRLEAAHELSTIRRKQATDALADANADLAAATSPEAREAAQQDTERATSALAQIDQHRAAITARRADLATARREMTVERRVAAHSPRRREVDLRRTHAPMESFVGRRAVDRDGRVGTLEMPGRFTGGQMTLRFADGKWAHAGVVMTVLD